VLRHLNTLAGKKPSKQRTELICLSLKYNMVELVQKMWRQHLRPVLLDNEKVSLPGQLDTSLEVMILTSHSALGDKL